MIRRPPRSTRTDTLFPYTTLFRSLGRADNALSTLQDLNDRPTDGVPFDQRSWSLTLAAEINARMEHHDAAQKAFDRASAAIAAAGDHDPYFQVAEAAFLLDQQRPALEIGEASCREKVWQ